MTAPVKPDEQKPPVVGEGGEGEPEAFDRGKLNPILRDMSPEQINDLLETMSAGIAEGRRAAAEPPPKPAPEPPKPPGDLKELLNPGSEKYNPEAALDWVIRKNYGSAVQDISRRSLEGVILAIRAEFPDFKDYEPEIRKAIATADPTTVNQETLASLYLQAKGLKITRQERSEAAKKAGAATLAPSAPAAPKKEEELSAIEVEVANKMFRRHADPTAEYKKRLAQVQGGGITLKVPVGDGKKE